MQFSSLVKTHLITIWIISTTTTIRSTYANIQPWSSLQVHIPRTLKHENGGYDHQPALFGVPKFGGSIQERVYYANSTFCDSNINFDVRTLDNNYNNNNNEYVAPYILMVDRGECSFVQKVRNAQHVGAAAVIVADNVCMCGLSRDICTNPVNAACQGHEPVMSDDGSGNDVSIPSFLMYKQDADKIKEVLLSKQNNAVVQMELSWNQNIALDDRVEYDVWTEPFSDIGNNLIETFYPIAKALGTKARFTPHQYIIDGMNSHCFTESGLIPTNCGTQCTNNGRYCATDPDGDIDTGLTGADVVKESLRRICIWDKYGYDGIGTEWWTYIIEFNQKCLKNNKLTDETCINNVYAKANIDANMINRCMSDSGDITTNFANTKLSVAVFSQKERGIVIKPSVFVNEKPVKNGPLSASMLFQEICSGYADNAIPPICNQCMSCSKDIIGCVTNKGVCPNHDFKIVSNSISLPTFLGSLIVFLVFFSIGSIINTKRRDDAVRSQVRGLMAEYMPLDVDRDHSITSTALSLSSTANSKINTDERMLYEPSEFANAKV